MIQAMKGVITGSKNFTLMYEKLEKLSRKSKNEHLDNSP